MKEDKMKNPENNEVDGITEVELNEQANTANCSAETNEPESVTENMELDALKLKLATLEDQHLRLAAEFANYQNRTAKEKEAIYKMALADVITAWLPVLDNVERAMTVIDNEKLSKDDPLCKGVLLVMQQVNDVLTNLGVSEIEAQGKTFDPMKHNAVFHIEDETLPPEVVAEVLQKGYAVGDKVIRHSVVKVAN